MLNDMTIELSSEDLDVLRKAQAAWDEDDKRSSKYADDAWFGYRTVTGLNPFPIEGNDWIRLVSIGVLEEKTHSDSGTAFYRITQLGRDILKAEGERTAIVEYRVLDEDLLVLRAARRAFTDDTMLGSKIPDNDWGYRSAKYLHSAGYETYDWLRAEKAGWLQYQALSDTYRITQAGLNLLKDLAGKAEPEAAESAGEEYIVDPVSGKLTPANPTDYQKGFDDGYVTGYSEAEEAHRHAVKAHFAAYSPRAEFDDVASINPNLVFAEIVATLQEERIKVEHAERDAKAAKRDKQRFEAGFSQLALMFDCLSEMAHEQDEYGNYAGDLRGAVKFASLVAGRLQRDLVDGVREPGDVQIGLSFQVSGYENSEIPF